MREYVIMADVNTDIQPDYAVANGIAILPQYYHFNDGVIYGDEQVLTPEQFYSRLKNERAYSMGCNPERVRGIMEAALKEDKDIIAVMCSSECSGSYNTVRLEAEELCELYPGARIAVIDTLLEAAPANLLVHLAVDMKAAGSPIDDVVQTLEEKKSRCDIYFLVDSLDMLVRGGRLSPLSGAVGTALHIKPILHFENGKIVSWQKARGSQAAKRMILESLKSKTLNKKYFALAHTVNLPETEAFSETLERELPGVRTLFIEDVTLIIGAHVGPGVTAVAFMEE